MRGEFCRDLLKCDAAGAEVEVFRGVVRLLRKKQSGFLVEMHSLDNWRQPSVHFAVLGYACTALHENHILALPQ